MSLHPETFQYRKPTDEQMAVMAVIRNASTSYAEILDQVIPDGADKTYVLRKLRELAMWANVAIVRNGDGSPRHE